MKISTITLALLMGTTALGNATIIGFGQLGGNNTTIPASLGSNAIADGLGFVVTNGLTPNIGLVWDSLWDVHTSNFFAPLENLTIGGGSWDNEGNIPRIAQLDIGTHTIGFTADPGFALVLNSFDFAHTAETAGTTDWNLSLTDSSLAIVWQTTVHFENGSAIMVAPNFTGALGESYTLHFDRTASTYGSDGRHGIDNLSFTQVPEPAAFGLANLAGLAVLSRRRRSRV
jgi:hypothetical protein